MYSPVLALLCIPFASAIAKTVVVTVTNGTAEDPSAVFTPPSVSADPNDQVVFNFTSGTHSVTQSTFAAPCVPEHITNSSINSFDSGLRPAGNGSAITTFNVDIDSTETIWYYDTANCGLGAVGVININKNATLGETLDGFKRNAIRLNGTASSASGSGSASSPSATTPSNGSTPSGSGTSGSNSPSPSQTQSSDATTLNASMILLGVVALALSLI